MAFDSTEFSKVTKSQIGSSATAAGCACGTRIVDFGDEFHDRDVSEEASLTCMLCGKPTFIIF